MSIKDIIITERRAPTVADYQLVEPKLPESAWRGLFARYRDLVAPTTEASDHFHFAAFLQVVGCTLGRRLYVYHAGRQYPNFFNCLVGRSGLTRKDTTWSRAEDMLERLHSYPEADSPPFRTIRGLRSYEGLLDELAGFRKSRLIILGELLSLLAKAKQDTTSNLIPQLTELYDNKPRINPSIHQKDVKPAEQPFLSIIAGTTQDWLQKALTERDIYGGFANRWCYFYGVPKGPMPNPPKMDAEKQEDVISEINDIRKWAEDVGRNRDGEIRASEAALDLFNIYYDGYYRRCQDHGLIPTLIVRIQDHAWKIALLYAAQEMKTEIEEEHMVAALSVAEYLEASVAQVFANFGTSRGKAEEQKLLERLRVAGKEIEKRELYRQLNMSASEMASIVDPLYRAGLIQQRQERSKNGKALLYYRLG